MQGVIITPIFTKGDGARPDPASPYADLNERASRYFVKMFGTQNDIISVIFNRQRVLRRFLRFYISLMHKLAGENAQPQLCADAVEQAITSPVYKLRWTVSILSF